MAFAIRNRFDAKARAAIRAAQGFELAFAFGARHAARAVAGNAPAANHRINPAALRDGVFVAHQHHHAAAFARPEAGRALIKHAHVVGRERTRLGEADNLKRVEAQVHAAREGDFKIAGHERRAGVRDGEQGTGARAVHGVAATFQIKLIADAPGDGVRESASK